MSVPPRTIEPLSGLSRPTSDLRKTDLPVPEGPSRTEISPGGRVSVTSLQMFWLPKDLVSPSTSTATPTTSRPPLRPRCRSPPRRLDEPRQCATPQSSPHPDGYGPLLLTSNDRAAVRLRVSHGFRDPRLPQLDPGETRVHLRGGNAQGPPSEESGP